MEFFRKQISTKNFKNLEENIYFLNKFLFNRVTFLGVVLSSRFMSVYAFDIFMTTHVRVCYLVDTD